MPENHFKKGLPSHIEIPEVCSKQCFGDHIRMTKEEKKCLITCFQRERQQHFYEGCGTASDEGKKYWSLIF